MCVLHTLKCGYKALITRKWENVLMVCQYKKDNTVTAITILILNLMFMDKNPISNETLCTYSYMVNYFSFIQKKSRFS